MNNLEFKHLNNLIFIIIPIICLILIVLGFRKKEKILSLLKLNMRAGHKFLRILLTSIGLAFIMLSLLGPQVLKGYTEVEKKGLDIYVLIDTSKSMLVSDIKPDRMSRAKKVIENIIDHMDGDRIGFIPFTSSAYIQMPLTDDYQMAKMFLNVIDTDMISGTGTNIGSAISLAGNSFEDTSSADSVVIILSDGEDQETGSLDALKKLNLKNLHVFTIGIGTEKGGLIPIYDASGTTVSDYMKDNSGQYVTSKLMPDTLKSLATQGHGAFYQSTVTGDEITQLMNDISTLKKDTIKTDRINQYKQLYQYFLGAGMFFIILAYLLPEGNKKEKEELSVS